MTPAQLLAVTVDDMRKVADATKCQTGGTT